MGLGAEYSSSSGCANGAFGQPELFNWTEILKTSRRKRGLALVAVSCWEMLGLDNELEMEPNCRENYQ